MKTGESFLVDNFDTDLGFNDFMGNAGAIDNPSANRDLQLSDESNGSTGGSLLISRAWRRKPTFGNSKTASLKWMIPLMVGQAAVFGLIVKWLVGA